MRKFLLIHLLYAAALAAAIGAGILASPSSPPSPWTSYYQLTLQVGSSYEINLKPDSAMCNRADARRAGRVADDATFASSSGGGIAQQSATGFRNQRGGNPWRNVYGPFGPVNGLALHQRADGLWLVGEPHSATTSAIPIYYSRTCRYSAGSSYLGTTISLTVAGVGTHPDVSATSRAHQHHHPEYALASGALTQTAADARYASAAHVHAPTVARWADTHAEYANTCRNLGGYYDTAWQRGATPRSDPHGHCCIPAEASSGISTASECQNSLRPQQQREVPPPAPPAPTGQPQIPDLEARE